MSDARRVRLDTMSPECFEAYSGAVSDIARVSKSISWALRNAMVRINEPDALEVIARKLRVFAIVEMDGDEEMGRIVKEMGRRNKEEADRAR